MRASSICRFLPNCQSSFTSLAACAQASQTIRRGTRNPIPPLNAFGNERGMIRLILGSLILSVTLISTTTRSEAAIIFDNGQIPAGQGEELLGNALPLAYLIGSMVSGSTNQTQMVMDFLTADPTQTLEIIGGQAEVRPLNHLTLLGDFSIQAHTAHNLPAGFYPMLHFSQVEFALTPEQKINGYVKFEAYNGGTLLGTSDIFSVDSDQDKRFHISGNAGEVMTSIRVLTSASDAPFAFISDVKQIRVQHVPEPATFVLCGIAAAGLVLSARRRRAVSSGFRS